MPATTVVKRMLMMYLLYIHTPVGLVPEDRSLRIAVRRFSSLLVCIIDLKLTKVKLQILINVTSNT